MLEGLATGGEFGWYGPYLPHWRGPRGPTADGPFRSQSGQAVWRRQTRGPIGGGVAPFAERTGCVAIFGKRGVAVGEGSATVL